jgi:DNA-binding transcriptional LysR family regulator
VLVGSPDLYRAQRDCGPNDLLQLLVYPPDSFFGKVLQGKAMPALLKQRRVVMTCISEFSFGLKELALIGQGAAWLPHSMVRRELQEDRQRQLDFLADPVPLTIGVYFARYSTEAVRKLADRLNCPLGN